MCGSQTLARQVSDYMADLVRATEGLITLLDKSLDDNQFDQGEIQQVRCGLRLVRPLVEEANDSRLDDANDVATGYELIKLVCNKGTLEPLHPETQVKLVTIAERRILRDQRRKRETATRLKLVTASADLSAKER